MSINLNSLATWSYTSGTLRKLSAPTGEVTIDIAANPALHTALSAPQWKNLGSTTVYSDNPADWVERRIKWNRFTEDPPVLQIEKTIGAGDYVNFNVYLLEDAPDYVDIFQAMADALNHGVLNGFTAAHVRSLLKNMVKVMQKFGLIGGNGV